MREEEFDVIKSVDKNGKLKIWMISVKEYELYSIIKTEYGYENGKMTESCIKIENGKNRGKKNETSHYEQAIMEAKSKWNKKRESIQEEDKPRFPMLAEEFEKNEKKVMYPCYVQPKLDGYRMIYDSDKKTVTTRQGKELKIISENAKELYEELSKLSGSGVILDGELYVHNDKDTSFETLGVLRRTKNFTKEDLINLGKINYNVYDVIDNNLTFEERMNKINELLLEKGFNKIRVVKTEIVKNKKEIMKKHEEYVKDGYEGIMIRNMVGKYKEKYRSSDLLKYKEFKDSEFKIIGYGYEQDRLNQEEKLIVWEVEIAEGIKCSVRPKGTKEERQYLYLNGDEYIGKKIWLKFQDYTADGNLRFPTTQRESYKDYIRDEII
uniref:ATP-dependent DNA ligase family profile domain-containing protein n=1 Tax=viral metagenome TaxID=1070528 RepID=A0A6C0H577_9ZZZZ